MDAASWYNPLAGWIGWVATGVIFVVVAYVWYRFRKRKNSHVSKIWPSITILGFGGVSIPKFYPMLPGQPTEEPEPLSYEVAQLEARILYDVKNAVWEKCIEQYGVTYNTNEAFQQNAQGWCVDDIGVTSNPDAMPEGHPFVAWGMPHGGIKLLFQFDMYFWFAHEVHNVFRYVLHGPLHIYDTVDAGDLMDARVVQEWINEEWPSESGQNRFPDA